MSQGIIELKKKSLHNCLVAKIVDKVTDTLCLMQSRLLAAAVFKTDHNISVQIGPTPTEKNMFAKLL